MKAWEQVVKIIADILLLHIQATTVPRLKTSHWAYAKETVIMTGSVRYEFWFIFIISAAATLAKF